MRQELRILFCGEGIALSAVIEYAKRRGHQIAGVYATSESEARMLRQSESYVSQPAETVEQFAAARHYDVLLSINNGLLLPRAAIERAGLAAINFHNSLLPAYAGLRATTWAILNDEAYHGISWHRMEPGIDTGNIILQRRFAMSPQETTASLNARCTEAAIESLGELFTALESGALDGQPQDRTARSYFGRVATAPLAGLIDWRWPGDRIVRLIRACDWGGTPNDFGLATLALPDHRFRYALQGSFLPQPPAIATPPGSIVGVAGERIQVACADGVLNLRVDRALELAPGEHLPVLDTEAVTELAAVHRAALDAERGWLPALQQLAERPRRRGIPAITSASHDEDARLLAAVDRVLGGGALVALEAAAAPVLTCGWLPVRARQPVAFDKPAPLRDVALRYPHLAGLADWWNGADFRIARAGSAGRAEDAAHDEPSAGAAVVRAVQAAMQELAVESAAPRPAPDQGILHDIQKWAAKDPDATAIEEGTRRWTRREVLERATTLAHALLAAGLRPRAGVGILLDRSAEFVIAALASMLARGAYVPLNLASPEKRRVVEIADGGITHLITQRARLDDLPVLDVDVICFEDASPGPTTQPLPVVSLDDSAYRIFTSGSTGRPKAVEVTHAALENLSAHYRQRLRLEGTDRTTFLAHPTFDASVADIWPILAVGGTLLIPPANILLDPLGLIDWLRLERITHTFVPTAIGSRLLGLPWPRGMALRYLLTGGEALHVRPPEGLSFELINSYGPTENTVDSLWHVVTPGEGAPPIGTPIGGVTAQVLDGAGNLVPPGELGELVLGGRQVARGYFGRPDLTAERFQTHPFGPGLWYRTGDRVRVNAAGEYEFHGRIDNQVQLHGIRVEPGEIEALLRADARVREAVCVPRFEGQAVTGLTAHVASPAAPASLPGELMLLLRAQLVPALVPEAIVIHDELPRTAAGKTDRVALAALSQQRVSPTNTDSLEAIWCSLLPAASTADPERSFWDLGGTSIAVMKLLLAVHESTGVRVPIASFLSTPTLAGLRLLAQQHPRDTVIEFRKGSGTPLVFWYGLSGDLEQFQHVINEDLGDRPVLGVMSPVTLEDGVLPETLEEAVRQGLAALRAHGVTRAPAMVGISFGGLLAFEAARQLAMAGTPAAFVYLIGTFPPQASRGRIARFAHFLRWMPVGVYRKLRQGDRSFSVRAMFGRVARLLGAHGAEPPVPEWPAPIYYLHASMANQYLPQSAVPLDLFLVRDLDSRQRIDHYGYVRYDKPDLGWQQWTGRPVTMSWMSGDHEAAGRRAYAKEFAALLRAPLASTAKGVNVA